jgi:hypothetical protein
MSVKEWPAPTTFTVSPLDAADFTTATISSSDAGRWMLAGLHE